MSFVSSNENFIRIKLYSDMRGMSLQGRIAHYEKFLKTDTLRRLNDYFKPAKQASEPQSDYGDLFERNTKETNQKRTDYEEILRLLKDFEFDTIIKSIYFEENADELFYHLKETIVECVPSGYQDEYSILDLFKKPNGSQTKISVTDFIRSIFISDLDISLNDWNSENKTRHQTIYKLCDWLEKKLKEEQSEREIMRLLFHYTKYWNIYFARLSDDAKKIFLLNRLSGLFETKGHEFAININGILQQLENELSKILSIYSLPPFLVTKEYLTSCNIKATTGYESQIGRFLTVRNETNNYFRNFAVMSFKELLDESFKSTADGQKHLYSQIFKKMDKGEIPSLMELKYFTEILAKKKIARSFADSQNFVFLFSSRNYLFENLNLD